MKTSTRIAAALLAIALLVTGHAARPVEINRTQAARTR